MAEIDELFPEPPPGWRFTRRFGPEGHIYAQILPKYDRSKDEMMAIVDIETKEDGRKWMHVSVSHRRHKPNHTNLSKAKDAFIGKDLYAYTIWAPADKHVNIHPHCLHLWACLDVEYGKILPEFSGLIPGLGRNI